MIDSVPTPPVLDSLDDKMRSAMRGTAESLGLSDSVLFSSALPDSAINDSTDEGPTWDIDVQSYATHDWVLRYMSLFTGSAKARVQERLQRGKRYEPMVREKFRARGIPEDMYYLGLVESGYDPHAYSRAAAVGMWQFMSSTARGMGLRVDPWIDERRDPIKSTDAAARFLNDLYKQFGSYYLAAAAYNGGPGRVSRGLSRFQDELDEAVGDDKFFALAERTYLRSETRNYVPQLIAAALIGKTPARYGMAVNDSVPLFVYDSVRIGELTALATIGRLAATTPAEMRDLNPHFLRGATPPRFSGWVRIPVGRAAGLDSQVAALGAEARGFSRVRSRKGQTLGKLAVEYQLDARRLSWYNPGLSTTKRLAPGTPVLVPSPDVLATARDVPNPSIERYGPSAGRGGRLVHVVRRGESLGSIARRYRTSVAALQRVNGLRRTVVYPGQSIIVSRRAGGSRAGARRATTKAKSSRAGTTAPATKRGAPRKGS